MFDRIARRCTLEGRLVTRSALHIGTQRMPAPVGTEHPVLRDAVGRPFIPGASLKGALRSHLEAYARGATGGDPDGRVACDPVGPEEARCIPSDAMRQLKREHRDSDADLADALWACTCLLCRTFGAPWWASVVRVVDAEVVPELWAGQFEVRNGVAIDRDKGAAAHQRLYSYEVVPAGTTFAMRLTARNPLDWQLGLLWLGVRALAGGQIALGGMRYRGLGWVRLEDFTFTLVEPEAVLTWLAGGVEGLTLTDPDDSRAKPWIDALQSELRAAGAEMEEAAYA